MVRARVSTINGFSAHADREDLLRWVGRFRNRPVFFVTHGENSIAEGFARLLSEKGYEVYVPRFGDTFDLRRKAVTAAVSPLVQKENLVDEIEKKLQELKGETVVLDERASTLLRSALILIEEAKAAVFNR